MSQPQEPNQETGRTARINPAAGVGTVSLKVADLRRSLSFYNDVIGLQTIRSDEKQAVLGAGSRPIMILEELPGAQPQPPNTTGLYHAAILFPDRFSLAVKIAQIASMHYQFGQSDHLVSEAFYLPDPDGNGLELYRDRPRPEWAWENGQVRMALNSIDFDDFFAEVKDTDQALSDVTAPAGTKLGHVHLRVADIPIAERFYHGVLGFDVTASMPGALFLSAGGYHHHIGMNTWESRGGRPPVEPSVGLREFSLTLPDPAELERLSRQIEAAGVPLERADGSTLVRDPFHNSIRLTVAEESDKEG